MKTLAIRLDDELHAQLSVLAQLRESTITDEIRMALESHLEASKASPELSGRAQAVLDEIERDSKARQAAIARYGLMSAPGQRVSSRVDFGLPAITRKLAVRLSTPQVGLTGAQKQSTSRL